MSEQPAATNKRSVENAEASQPKRVRRSAVQYASPTEQIDHQQLVDRMIAANAENLRAVIRITNATHHESMVTQACKHSKLIHVAKIRVQDHMRLMQAAFKEKLAIQASRHAEELEKLAQLHKIHINNLERVAVDLSQQVKNAKHMHAVSESQRIVDRIAFNGFTKATDSTVFEI